MSDGRTFPDRAERGADGSTRKQHYGEGRQPLEELWRPIPGYPAYEISNYGQIKRLKMPDSLGRNYRPEKNLKVIDHSGQMIVELFNEGQGRQYAVHILVLTIFDRVPIKGEWGLHWDDDHTNNYIGNLRWGTPKENSQDAIRNGSLGTGSSAAQATGWANSQWFFFKKMDAIGWAPEYTAGVVLTALRQDEPDLRLARWYWARLGELAERGHAKYVLGQLRSILSADEIARLS